MEFLNYKVTVTLKGEPYGWTGTIKNVDSAHLQLENAAKSADPAAVVPNFTVPSGNIADLKVVHLPPELTKNSRKKCPDSGILDEATVFTKGSASEAARLASGSRGQSRAGTPKSRGKQGKYQDKDGISEWDGSSDVQKIKASADFDFAANLAMFDKKQVFADLHKQDTVQVQDRLVGHNRAESQSKKKEKYGNDEMVLDTSRSDNWDAIGCPDLSAVSSANTSSASLARECSATPIISSKPKKSQGTLVFESGKAVQLALPVQLLEVERLATESFGVTTAMMNEVCASNLFGLVSSMLGGAVRLSNTKNHNLPPLVLLLVGTGRCGARALALGRHLTNHGIRVLGFVISEDEQDTELAHQKKLFESHGGKILALLVAELLAALEQLDTPVELIVDALQGYDGHLEDIFYTETDLQMVQELIAWANKPKQRNKILSLDVSAGIDGGLGTVQTPSLKLSSRWIVSMGLPIAGLAHAYKNGSLSSDADTTHYLVDVGIPNAVYSAKANLRKFDGFWFCAESALTLVAK